MLNHIVSPRLGARVGARGTTLIPIPRMRFLKIASHGKMSSI